jgi:hypothetical protein
MTRAHGESAQLGTEADLEALQGAGWWGPDPGHLGDWYSILYVLQLHVSSTHISMTKVVGNFGSLFGAINQRRESDRQLPTCLTLAVVAAAAQTQR